MHHKNIYISCIFYILFCDYQIQILLLFSLLLLLLLLLLLFFMRITHYDNFDTLNYLQTVILISYNYPGMILIKTHYNGVYNNK